jgi:hypothetical protein
MMVKRLKKLLFLEYYVNITNEENVLGVELELGDELVLCADQEDTLVPRDAGAAIGNIGALIGFDGLVLHNVHVVLQGDD